VKLKILVACEESQTVCKAFRERGHEAYSCDLQRCSGGHPEWHIKGDALKVLNPSVHENHYEGFGNFEGIQFFTMDGEEHEFPGKWDLIIAHPPCTYITNAGARWLYAGHKLNEERYVKGLKGALFFMKMFAADCDKIAIENPVPGTIFNLPPYKQVIQPYEYGHPYSKKTCLWLRGLPPLKPTKLVSDFKPFVSSGSYTKTHDPRYKGASRKGGAAKMRSKTFPGIAKAMADQWGEFLERECEK
jgi:hypothetical protein